MGVSPSHNERRFYSALKGRYHKTFKKTKIGK
jgi:hypothetical protein